LTSGDVLLCDLSPVAGREQGGIRPVLVVSHHRYSVIPGLVVTEETRQRFDLDDPATRRAREQAIPL
jgi:mRNA-degrading endonuclease toxin of MazEF toxin-antitoxin module